MRKKTVPEGPAAEEIDANRRKFLVAATSVVGAAGVAGVAYPLITSMYPSRKAVAEAQPVEVDISKLQPGQQIQVSWRHKPVWILHRSKEQLATLDNRATALKDPDSSDDQQLPQYANPTRSLRPEISVLVAICTHLGCIPDYMPKPGSVSADWLGGYFCPCHGSRYDLAGRVFAGSPAPMNLPVPPYYFMSDAVIKVGELKDGSESNWRPAVW
ncbi:MAG TPA: ubiquinol-cytochrome c reductase iron-sulfur subunit [Gammaproteobacteria bacterium]|nr:ubiquinol-cytochrome c reductase iron-sulfur subunit [Gammaproteobacteria bacterium]